MSVTLIDGIGYSPRTKAAFIAPSGAAADGKQFTAPKEKDAYAARPWAFWGDANNLPVLMARDIEECGVLSAGLDMKARIAMGKGLMPFLLLNVDQEGKEELEFVDDSEIHDWF